MTRKNKIRAISGLFVIFAIGMGIVALRPLSRVAKAFIVQRSFQKAADDDTFETVNIAIYDAKDQKINISASQVTKNKNENALLKRMTSSFSFRDGEKCNISADMAKTIDRQHIDFKGNVKLQTSSGLTLSTSHTLVDLAKKTASEKAHVEINKDDMEISGDDYLIDLGRKHLSLKQKAKASSNTESIEAESMEIKLKDNNKIDSAKAVGNVVYNSSQYTISAAQMTLSGNLLELSQNVHITKKEKNGHIYGNRVILHLGSENEVMSAEVTENARYLSSGKSLQAKKMTYNKETLLAQGNVVFNYHQNGQKYEIITSSLSAKILSGNISQIESMSKLIIKANGDTICADSGVVKGNKLFLYGNVSASGSAGNVLGDRAELDLVSGDIDIRNSSGIVEEGRNAK